MTLTVDIGTIVPSALATCCLVADRRERRATVWTPSVLMLLAMVDGVTTRLLPDIIWATALVLTATIQVALGRRTTRKDVSLPPMQLHRAIATIVMAGMLVAQMPEGSAVGHEHGLSIGAVSLAAGVGTLALGIGVAWHTWRASDSKRHWARVIACAEPLLMSTALLAMQLQPH